MEIHRSVLPKQAEVLRATEREVMYSGAFGAGKSVLLSMWCLQRAAASPYARVGLCRKHLVSLKSSTLKTLLQGDGDNPPVLPPGTYTHNKSEKEIRIRGGGEINYFGLDDPDKVGSRTFTDIAVDEAIECMWADWQMLLGRLRGREGAQIICATNPGPPSHWLAVRFGISEPIAGAEVVKSPDCRVVHTRTPDNFFLPADFVATLDALPGVSRKRYFEGLWVGSEGLVYDKWDRARHVWSRTGPWVRKILCVDEGYTNPFALLELCEDAVGGLHVAREMYQTGLTEAPKVAAVRRWMDGHEAVVIDPSAAGLIAAMRAEGLPVMEADNAVFDGICGVQSRLENEIDGVPALTVEPGCDNTCREFETYAWKEQKGGVRGMKDEPVKSADHAMDALRYGVRYVGGGRVTMFVSGPGDEGQDDDWGWQ